VANKSSKRIQNEAPLKKRVQRFYAVIEIETPSFDGEDWGGDNYDVAAWLASGMGDSSKFESAATVWNNLADFTQDNALEALADVLDGKASSDPSSDRG
jgi:hypothetical protein